MPFQTTTGQVRPRIHWCPTGAFTFVPLHAAGIYDGMNQECCSDYVVSSYTPTLTALLRAQDRGTAVHITKLLLIAEDSMQNKELPSLWNVAKEIKIVEEVARKADIAVSTECPSSSARISQVASLLESVNVVHLACHGVQNISQPLESGFCLSDGRLTIHHLMDMDLKHAFFAFLSACETATGDVKQPDQTIHLAAAMLFAGFRSIVATMW
jgi:CHAT domain-containing protein